MRDEDPAKLDVIPPGEPVGDVRLETLGKRAAIFFCDAHFAVLDLDAGPELEQICTQQRHGGAASAFFHVFKLLENEARVDAGRQRLELLHNLLRPHAFGGHARGLKHDVAMPGGEVARIDHVDIRQIGRGQLRVLMAA